MEPQTTPHVYRAITLVRAALAKEGIAKSRENKDQKFHFRGIDDVYNTVSRLLAEYQLCIMPSFSERAVDVRTTKSGSSMFNVTVRGAFAFVSSVDGSSHTVVTYGEAQDTADKATNKAMSAAMKYALMETFTIPTEGDNDADGSSPEETVVKYTPAELATIESLKKAAAGGTKALKVEWQKLDVKVRERVRGELDGLAEIAGKSEPQVQSAPEQAAA